ncbi:MAG: carbohydrate kinase [Ginsengibacter sp.]
MSNKIIVGFGEVLWDILGYEKLLGGAPANFGYHCKQLGADAKIVSAVGNDELGDEIIQHFIQKGLPTEYLQRTPAYPTGTVTVEIDERGVPSYIIHEPVAWDYIEWNDSLQSLSAKADAICFGSLSQRDDVTRATLQRMLRSVSQRCLKVFDINLRQPFYTEQVLLESLQLANVVKMNIDEALIVGDMFNWGDDVQIIVLELFKKFNFQLIAITYGEDGSKLFTPDRESFMEVSPVKISDTIGAGDSFTAAMVTGWLNQSPLAEIHELATNLSAYICTQRGAMPSYDKDFSRHLRQKD